MKRILLVITVVFIFFMLSPKAFAQESIYEDIFDALSDDVYDLMDKFGVNEGLYESFNEVSPERVFGTVKDVFFSEIKDPLAAFGILLALIVITSVIQGFLPEKNGFSEMGKCIALMCIMFSVINFTSEIFMNSTSALTALRDFMLVLIPVFASILSFSGNPSLALSFNSVAFSFGEAVTFLFESILPVLASLLICLSVASCLSPFMKLDGISRTVSKAVNLFMAFCAGIFVAVLSVRGVIAGASDTVAIRGVRFLVGNTVPIVGSALGEALNSVIAGFSLIKNTAGMLGVAAVLVTALLPLIRIGIWKGILYCTALISDIFDNKEIKSFSECISGVLSVLFGAVLFTVFVYIICIAIMITVSRG